MSMELKGDDRTITFKHNVSLSDFSKAITHFRKAFYALGGKEGTYKDFTSWLESTDLVDVSQSLTEVNDEMKLKLHEPGVDPEVIDLLDKYFPKGKAKERGAALVFLAQLVIKGKLDIGNDKRSNQQPNRTSKTAQKRRNPKSNA